MSCIVLYFGQSTKFANCYFVCFNILTLKNVQKLTYSNVEFQKISGGRPPEPLLKRRMYGDFKT